LPDAERPDASATPGSSEISGSFGAELDLDRWFERLGRANERGDERSSLGRLGEYELLALAGRGGQGVVYKARQPRTGRIVALKRLAAGSFSTAEMRARFEREIEIAAALDHPNVVTVFGSDLLDGQFVLAMQWVDGLPLDRWADCDGPAPREARDILDTFVRICDAVHHAHQRGVIHRDLKPSNTLVDAGGQPHVLDFGLAKLTRCEVDESRASLTGGPIGTPAFAAPEMVSGNQRDVDVRSDVYSLGVMLYQVLTGHLPHEPTADWARLIDDIRHRDPPAPRQVNAGIDRELDAIIRCAIAKEIRRRYESVAALAADIRRYLLGEAVQAHPPSRAYFARKFIRRHRWAVLASVGALALMAAATIVSSTLYVRAERQRERADQERGRAERGLEENREASRRLSEEYQRAQITTEFLRKLFEFSTGGVTGGGPELTVREVLDRACAELDSSGGAYEPLAEATLRMIVGNAYRKLGFGDRAERNYLRALDLRRKAMGPEGILVAETMDALGRMYRVQGRLAEAETLIVESYRIRKAKLEPNDGYLALAANNLGLLKRSLGKHAEAEAAFLDSLRRYLSAFGPDNESIPLVLANLGVACNGLGRSDETETYWREGLALALWIHGELHEDVASLQLKLGRFLDARGERGDAAESALRAAADIYARVYGTVHGTTLSANEALAGLLFRRQKPDEGEEMFRCAIAAASDAQHWADAVRIGTTYGKALLDAARRADAEFEYGRALALASAHLNPQSAEFITLCVRRAELLLARQELAEAVRLLAQAQDILAIEPPQFDADVRGMLRADVQRLLADSQRRQEPGN
jgi:tetratricopeptide (TPR) repeat protein/tRNA A-37 threonylcarbamoyl transferase component Bud32